MGNFCSKDSDSKQSQVDLRYEIDRVRGILKLQQGELILQTHQHAKISQFLSEKKLQKDEDPLGNLIRETESTLSRVKTDCEETAKRLDGLQSNLSYQHTSGNRQRVREELSELNKTLGDVHSTLKKTHKALKHCEKPRENKEGDRRCSTEVDGSREVEEKLADMERKLTERDKEISLLQARLSSHYSDISSDSDSKSPLYLEPPKANQVLSHQISELQVDMTRLISYNQKLLKEKVLLMFCTRVHMNMLKVMQIWRQPRGRISSSYCGSSNTDLDRSPIDQDDFLQKSPLFRGIPDADKSGGKAMSRTNALLLFESVMDEKFETDLKDISQGRRPKSPSEFLVEYINRRHGLANLAMNKLTQFALGVAKLQQGGSEYGKLISGVFNLIQTETMHANLSVFLPHARAAFLQIKDRKRRTERLRTSNSLSPMTTISLKGRLSEMETGGTAPLVGVCDLVYSLCKDFPACGQLLLRLIKPPELSIEDFVIFKICHKMAQEGSSPEDMFRKLDRDGGGTIDSQEFENGIKILMGLWLSPSDLSLALQKISDGQAELSRSAFFTHINFDVYFHSESGKNVTVTCCTFLMALQTLYQGLVQECRDAFTEACGSEEMQYQEFQQALLVLDPTLSDPEIAQIFNTRVAMSLDQSSFCEICQNEYLGKFKFFDLMKTEQMSREQESGRASLREKRRTMTHQF